MSPQTCFVAYPPPPPCDGLPAALGVREGVFLSGLMIEKREWIFFPAPTDRHVIIERSARNRKERGTGIHHQHHWNRGWKRGVRLVTLFFPSPHLNQKIKTQHISSHSTPNTATSGD
jgi:hypothetical protein